MDGAATRERETTMKTPTLTQLCAAWHDADPEARTFALVGNLLAFALLAAQVVS
jgi:hypothetical protein